MGYGGKMNSRKKIVFVTGTRADYGKMKSLMKTIDSSDSFELFVFVCGMHLSETFGSTYMEIVKDGYKNIHIAYGLNQSIDANLNLGNTISYFAGYVKNIKPDLIIVHGDRVDALAGAIVGAMSNIMVGHIEGGEVSGTIDESIRHAISKFSHKHFVCTEEARNRLIQLGEEENRIYVIGSPDIDIMMSENLPSVEDAKKRYDIGFDHYGILMYHPVTTEYKEAGKNIKKVVDAVKASDKNYIVIYPNNDLGSEIIINEYSGFDDKEKYRIFPSIRFEYFLTLLKNADFMIGNSSAGVREAGIYGVPSIDIGSRQSGRYSMSHIKNIVHTDYSYEEILNAIGVINQYKFESSVFGDGNSTKRFYDLLNTSDFWDIDIQKKFIDL